METKPIRGEQRAFMTGNEVIAWAALAAGAEVMYGYPITPQSEIMHYWARLAPRYGRRFLQTEDELAAGFTTLGAVLAGEVAFTATAGPGNVLMQEPLSMAEMMRLPAVVIIAQRGGPSTGTVIYSQQEFNLTCYGGNGEGLRIVYSPSHHQELFDYTLKAFHTAWKYRFPTFILGDGYQSKMREPVTLYDPAERGLEVAPSRPLVGVPGTPGRDRPPVHLRNTYNLEEELYEALQETIEAYDRAAPEIAEWEAYRAEDAEYLVVAHGVVARAAREGVRLLRDAGIRAGAFRPITLRPFPQKELREMASRAKTVLVMESSYGQLEREIRAQLYGLTVPLKGYRRPGVGITPEEVVREVQKYATRSAAPDA
ncbi:MAG TPA: ferredoxin oxidoreductase [Peptococcaceae bacterium]|nr:MAG: Pyruvate flavodoxin/ferredoxin oxidoreductase-like protein [Moorella sp. 60_41]HBT47620.1 ferredoxin oxidoreductase [Peptococcaceae bacterium]